MMTEVPKLLSFHLFAARTQANLPIAAIVTPLVVMAVILIGVGILFWRWWHKKRQEELELKARIQRVGFITAYY